MAEKIAVHAWSGSADEKPWPEVCEFFKFERGTRTFRNADAFKGCHVCDIRPVERVKGEGWGDSGPPHPGVFYDLFPEIGQRIVGSADSLYLHISGLEDWLFDEATALKEEIRPRRFQYLLLSPIGTWTKPEFLGNLIFECPIDFLPAVADKWFRGFRVEIEGYVMAAAAFPRIADYYFRQDTPETVREVLSLMRCGFRVWTDDNGLDFFSDKLDEGAVRSLLADL